AGALGAAADRAQVPGVRDAVEARQQRPLFPGQLVRVGIAVRLDARDDALVVARPGELGQRALGPQVHAWPLAQPRLGPERALAREQLEDLPWPAQRLA